MRLRTALILAAIALPGQALAVDELNYSYVEAGYRIGEVDTSGQDVDFHKVGGTASYELTENFALFGTGFVGEVETTDIGAPRDIDTRELSAGLTFHTPVYDNIDLVVPMAIAYARTRAGSSIESDTGYSIAAGIRALLTENIEAGAAIQHVDIEDDEQSLTGNVRFHINEWLSLSLDGEISDDVNRVGLGARYSF